MSKNIKSYNYDYLIENFTKRSSVFYQQLSQTNTKQNLIQTNTKENLPQINPKQNLPQINLEQNLTNILNRKTVNEKTLEKNIKDVNFKSSRGVTLKYSDNKNLNEVKKNLKKAEEKLKSTIKNDYVNQINLKRQIAKIKAKKIILDRKIKEASEIKLQKEKISEKFKELIKNKEIPVNTNMTKSKLNITERDTKEITEGVQYEINLKNKNDSNKEIKKNDDDDYDDYDDYDYDDDDVKLTPEQIKKIDEINERNEKLNEELNELEDKSSKLSRQKKRVHIITNKIEKEKKLKNIKEQINDLNIKISNKKNLINDNKIKILKIKGEYGWIYFLFKKKFSYRLDGIDIDRKGFIFVMLDHLAVFIMFISASILLSFAFYIYVWQRDRWNTVSNNDELKNCMLDTFNSENLCIWTVCKPQNVKIECKKYCKTNNTCYNNCTKCIKKIFKNPSQEEVKNWKEHAFYKCLQDNKLYKEPFEKIYDVLMENATGPLFEDNFGRTKMGPNSPDRVYCPDHKIICESGNPKYNNIQLSDKNDCKCSENLSKNSDGTSCISKEKFTQDIKFSKNDFIINIINQYLETKYNKKLNYSPANPSPTSPTNPSPANSGPANSSPANPSPANSGKKQITFSFDEIDNLEKDKDFINIIFDNIKNLNKNQIIELLGYYPDNYQSPIEQLDIIKNNKKYYEKILKLRQVFKNLNKFELNNFNKLKYDDDKYNYLENIYKLNLEKRNYFLLKDDLLSNKINIIKFCHENCNNNSEVINLSDDLKEAYNLQLDIDKIYSDYELIEIYHPELLIKEKTFFSKYKIVIFIIITLLIISILILIF